MKQLTKEAIDFTKRGLCIFPTAKKLPLIKNWPNLATTDEDQIIKWFEDNDIADGFGVCPKDIAVIIDVDVKEGKHGIKWLKYLIDEYKISRQTLIIKSKSGGLHLYYKYPKNIVGYIKSIANLKLSNGYVCDGIDIRGNKGQCVGPWSGNKYSIVNDHELAELPEAFINELPTAQQGGLKVNVLDAQSLTNGEESLYGVTPDTIPMGERDVTLTKLMASWARTIKYEQARIMLMDAVSKCEGNVDFDIYLTKLDAAYDKFKPVTGNHVDRLLETAIHIAQGDRVYFDPVTPGHFSIWELSDIKSALRSWVVEKDAGTYANGNPKVKICSAIDEWIAHPKKQMVENVGYKPAAPLIYQCAALGADVVNNYRAPIFDEEPGSVSIEPFTDLVEFLWGDYAYVMFDWCSHLVQNPDKKVLWAPVLITPEEGMGKNIFFNIMAQVLGQWNTMNITASQFNKSFNTFLVERQLIVVNELQEVGKRERLSVMGKLKNYITESNQTIEGKGQSTYTTEIFSNFIIFSNEVDALQIDNRSRRFFIHINNEKPQAHLWYKRIVNWYEKMSNISYLHKWLKERDLIRFDYANRAIETTSRQEMIDATKSEALTLVENHIRSRDYIFASDIITEEAWAHYTKHILHLKYVDNMKDIIKRGVLQRVRVIKDGKPTVPKYYSMPTIDHSRSDSVGIYRKSGNSNVRVFTCRHHGKYHGAKPDTIKDEYNKIFSDHKAGDNVVSILK